MAVKFIHAVVNGRSDLSGCQQLCSHFSLDVKLSVCLHAEERNFCKSLIRAICWTNVPVLFKLRVNQVIDGVQQPLW